MDGEGPKSKSDFGLVMGESLMGLPSMQISFGNWSIVFFTVEVPPKLNNDITSSYSPVKTHPAWCLPKHKLHRRSPVKTEAACWTLKRRGIYHIENL